MNSSDKRKQTEEYWRNALADGLCTPFPTLPVSVQEPVADSAIGHQISLLRKRFQDISTSNLIRAALALIGGRIANSDDVVFGVTVPGKNARTVGTNMIAASTSTVPVRVKLARGQSVAEYLEAAQRQATEMIPFEQTGLQRIAKICQGSQEACMFQTLLIIQPQHDDLGLEELGKVQEGSQQQRFSTNALTLEIQLGSDKDILISASFDSRVIEPWAVRSLLEQLESVICQLNTADPDHMLAEIEIITPNELERIWEWNKTVPKSIEQCVHKMIEERALIQPNAPAVCAWDGELTYRQLDQLATRLSGQLTGLGVRPDILVPLCFEKSMWATVAMLGVLKAGGGFVFLDPSLPEQRLQAIVQQVKATLILSSPTNQALSSRLAPETVAISSDFFRDLDDVAPEHLPEASPSSVLYVVFTSGSTGTPKGVVQTHRNMASAVYHQAELLEFSTQSRIFDFAAYSYDVSVSNAITALVTGGCLCVPSDQDRRSNLPGSIASLKANVAVFTPSIARFLSPEDMPELQMIILVGESVSITDVKRWWNNVRFVHRYGVSECPAASTINYGAYSAEEATRIGKGAGLVTWVVDQDNHDCLLPVGYIGELLLEGPLVSRGYLDDPEMTASKFIYDPAWLLQGAPCRPGRHGRLYKTGDLVRYNEDGSLTFIGRKDAQVKIRGQRAELGEIEYRVQECISEARQVVAEIIVPQGDNSSPALAVFLQITNNTATETNEPESIKATILPIFPNVEAKLAEYLPNYMMPSVFFSMRELPMTPTGKTNRKRLREIGGSFTVQQLVEAKTAGKGTKRQPKSQLEQQIQRIWACVLNVEQSIIGLDDSFLQVGGDSIAAMKVVVEARKVGVDLTVADIFRCPTLEQVAAQAHNEVESTPEVIPPFSLLGGGGRFDINSLLRDISVRFQLDLATIADAYPCTPLQEGLLSLSSTQPGNYIKHSIMEISPDIDIKSFCNAWEEAVRAMAIMRTRIVHHNDVGLVQVVLDEEICWIEATGLDRYIEADRKHPMEVGQPLVRYALVRDDMGMKKWFVCTVHHALYDGWSMPLILDAVHQVYQGGAVDCTPQFKTFIKYITEQDREEVAHYWRKTLTDCDLAPFPTLPASVQRPVADRVIEYQISHPPQGRVLNVTMSNMIRAAWALVVGRMTNSNDVVFGVTVSGRNAPVVGIDKMAAPTIATVPVYLKISKDQGVTEYLEAVQRQATEMIPFEQTGLQVIAKMCQGSQQACMFQTLLIIQPQESDLVAQNMLGKWQDDSQQQQRFDAYALTIDIQLGSDNDIVVSASFDSRVIEPWTVKKLLEQLDSVLCQLGGADPEQMLSEIQMVTEQDLESIWERNSTVPAPIEQCIHKIIEERAQAQPEAPAVYAWDGELTYSELDQLAARLARRLVHLGIGPDVVVPLCFEKSMWTAVAMLGVLKAGGAFVMLDASLPEQRLQSIVQEVDGSLILCSLSNEALGLRLAPEVFILNRGTIMSLSNDGGDDLTANGHLTVPRPSSVMYVVFTSGSTGTPKGAMLTHTNVASALHYQIELLGLTMESRVFDFASYSFDVCVNNVFSALVAGGCLCVPSDFDRKNNLLGSIKSLRANCIELTPSVAQLLSPEDLPELQTIFLGGEAVSLRDVERWWDKCQVINTYGPSECTATSTINSKATSPEEATGLGSGVGLVTWVVDPENHDNLLPLGCIGELVLEGPLVGRGYLNNPEKTAAVFIQDPAWLLHGAPGHPGRYGRLYKTGDLVQYNEDGTLTFVGRKDTQVKIRGQRVELGEIEQRVQECLPQARLVVADIIVMQGENVKPTLAVFLQMHDCVAETETARMLPITADIEDKLAEKLPGYMVPTVFFSMKELPITASGKTNRKRLREIGGSFSVQQLAKLQTERRGTRQQPTSELERQIQKIWAQVLNIEPAMIGLNDSFFRLGGDSITAMQVSSAARSLSINISTLDIMQKKKISSIVRGLAVTGLAQGTPIPPHERIDGDSSRQLSPIQRLYVHLQPDPTKCYDQSFLLRIRMKIGHQSLSTALEALVRRHSILRARFSKSKEGIWEQDITNDVLNSFGVRVHQRSAGSETAQVIAKSRESLDIERGPLVAAVLFEDTDEEPQTLFLAIHHLVIDLVSWRVLFRELEEFLTSGTITMPTPLGFQTWVDLQAQYAIKNLKPVAELEVQAPLLTYWGMEHNANLQGETVFKHFSIEKSISSALLGSCNDAFGTRPVELMLSALIYSFGLVFPDRVSPTIFSEGHGREPWDNTIDISSTVGWFTTIYPVQVTTHGNASLSDIIRRTKDCIRSLPQNGWSHFTSRFADETNATKFASEYPTEIMFNYAGLYQQLERSDALFEEVSLPDGCNPASSLELRRFTLFDIDARVEKGCIAAVVAYHKSMGHQQKILEWINKFELTMVQMAKELPNESRDWTLSDFAPAFQSYEDIREFRDVWLDRLRIRPEDVEDIFPCSPMQEGILVAQAKDTRNYRSYFELEIQVNGEDGARLDLVRLQQAWLAVVKQHALLRCVLIDNFPGSSRAMHVILKDPVPSISCLSRDEALNKNGGIAYQKYGLHHHLTIRELNERTAHVRLEVDHSIEDGFSSNMLLDDLQAAYVNNNSLRPAGAYRDFITYLGEQPHDAGLEFWTRHLVDVEPCFFPVSSPGNSTDFSSIGPVKVPHIDTGKLRAFCSTWEVTAATVIQVAWALVLRMYTGTNTPCFGNLCSGRDVPVENADRIFGPLIGMIPCRIHLDKSQSVLETLKNVQNDYLSSLLHQHFPLAEIHRALGLGASALFNSGLSFQRAMKDDSQDRDGLIMRYLNGDDPTEYDINISAIERHTDISIQLNFRPGSLTLQEATRLAGCINSAISEIISSPWRELEELNLLGAVDLEKIWEWNSTVPAPLEQCVHEIIEEKTWAQPSAPAVCAWDGELTYGELDKLAIRLAHRLIDLGVGPDVLVPLCFEKSMWTTVAILGVLKAGAAFVLLDPSLPEHRLQGIVQQVKAGLILSSSSNQALSSRLAHEVVIVGSDFFRDLRDDTVEHIPTLSPSSIMYVVFTSGSTGVPKGVTITHRNLASALYHQVKLFKFATSPRIFDFASYSFDASIFNTFITLAAGGCLCVPSDHGRKNDLLKSITMLRADVTILTPSVAQFLSPDDLPELQSLMFCGEAVHVMDVKPWWNKARVLNGYGPSECTPMSTLNYYSSSPKETTYIGKGAGLVTWIVDPENYNHLLPPGCIGELLLEGPLVGPGYLNDPEKTAAAFVDDPIWLLQGSLARPGRHGRLYKTGDLVSYNEDGSLTFIGRKDTQVKIHGQRVELGEVEQMIQQCMPEARQVVAEVILPQGDNSSPVLAAFMQMNDRVMETNASESLKVDILPITADVEDSLASHLPSYAVPRVFFSMPELPISATGKTDRKRLRGIGGSFSVQQLAKIQTIGRGTKRQPTTHVEQEMQRIWSQVLDIDPATISLDDSFFRLGGDSIAAMKVVSEARKVGIEVAVADIFSHPRLQSVASSGICLADDTPEDISPFSLLGDGFDITSLLEDVSIQCQVEPTAIEDVYPCTPLQEGLLSLSMKRPGDYIMQRTLELSPDIAIEAFCDAWQKVAQAMPILRTRIVQHNNSGFLQVVLDEEIQWIKATGLETYLEADRRQPMETGQPLIRYALVKDDVGVCQWFVWTVHHALYDGWSLALILNAVHQAYCGDVIERWPTFNQFVKYIREQDDERMTEYWRNALADCACAPFPALQPSLQGPVADGLIERQLSRPSERSLDITTSTLIRAAWALVAGRMTNSDDVVFGVTMSGRNAPVGDIDQIAGPTVATVPVRIKSAHNQKIADYLEAVQQQAAEMIPFEQTGLHRIAKIGSDGQQACHFQTLLVIQHQENSSGSNMLGTWRDGSHGQWINTYPLMLELQLAEAMVTATASFDSSVVGSWMVHKLLEQLDSVMQQLGDAGPERTLSSIEMVTNQDMEKIWEWNSTVPAPNEQCVHTMIEGKVRAQPGAPAVCAWDGELTYSELDQLATKLADRLIDFGVGPDVLVPLCFEKSMWTMVAIFGVLKAGGAFVLLDPALPEQRLRAIVQQVNATLVLSSPSNQALSLCLTQDVITISSDFFGDLSKYTSEHLRPEAGPSSTMYVVFTSGSTGTPKGVVITHRNLASALYHQVKLFEFTTLPRVFDFASYSFDASIFNGFITLAAGGCLCIPSDQGRKNDLLQSITMLRADVTILTPSVAHFLSPNDLPELQSLMFCGEAVHIKDIKPWWNKIRVLNGYGPSECTPMSTFNYNSSSPEETTHIGRGAGLLTWIVDPDNQNDLLPIGCIGELLLEGPLVSPGYLNDPQKTATAFIEDPDWLIRGIPGQSGRRGRLYKTGDLVQYNEDGSLKFIGRKDAQVKIRGQRVELGEVEHWVKECIPEARQVVADIIDLQGENAKSTLAVFLQTDDCVAETAQMFPVSADVEDNLAQHLPSYMVPTVFFSISELPMTATGKTDRRRLREIGRSFSVQQLAEMQTQETKRMPVLEVERQLQRIWAHVLNIDSATVGLDDSFFRLGGDSVTAMKVVGEARKIGIQLAVADIFSDPKLHTVAGKCVHLQDNIPKAIPPFALLDDKIENITSLVEDISVQCQVEVATIKDIYPCTPLQEGLLSLSLKRPGDYVMQRILELSPDLTISAFRNAWEEVTRSMAILRTRIVQRNDTTSFLQVVLDEEIKWIEATGLEAYLEADRQHPMETGQPLIRYAFINDDAGIHKWFVWTVHHALYDGWSLPLIVNAVHQVYHDDTLKYRPQPQFNSFVEYIGQQNDNEVTDYWREALADCDCVPFPALPPSVQQPLADTTIEYELQMRSRKRSLHITTANLLRAAWALVTGRSTNSDDIVCGVTVSGRTARVVGIDEIAGPTIATVPVRVKLAGKQSISEYLGAVQQQALDMVPFEHTGLHRIAKICPGSQQACMFQTLLVIQPPDGDSTQNLLGEWQDGSQQQSFNTYALTLEIQLGSDDTITAKASFDSRTIELDKMQVLLERLDFVMQQLDNANPEQTLSEIEVVTEHDLETIWGWNRTVPAPIERTVRDMIEDWARAQPSAPAVCAWDGELTYGELDKLATKLADRLVHLGVGPDVLVPLCFEKSMWTSVAILGVLKAGGAFVLLDPALPERRLQTIIQQVKATLILSSPSNRALGLRLAQEVITISSDFFGDLSNQSSEHLLPKVSSSSAMYVVFTSGSTGTPKGVMITHRNLASALFHQVNDHGITAASRVFDFASYSFDASIINAFMALAAGACLCVPSDEDRKNDLAGCIKSLHATVAHLTPSVAQFLVPEEIPGLHTVILAGEAVHVGDVKRWWGKVNVFNIYGPSECTPFSTINRCTSTLEDATGIGKGSGQVTWVVDPENHDHLVPLGCIGELLLEGPLVGPGYIGDPEKTAAAFIQDPAWLLRGMPGRRGVPGRHGRLYKTGDLVRYNEDGSLIFVGRKDAQVKIRGQRVELGEVEHCIQQYMKEVKQVVAEVITPQGQDSNPALAAFIQIDDATNIEEEEEQNSLTARILLVDAAIERNLAKHLPHYMVPTVFFSMRELPMTATGKTNRKRLREIGGSFSVKQLAEMRTTEKGMKTKQQPTSPAEQLLQRIWAQVLNIEPASIGLDDNFFQLGGDSITAMKVVGEARKLDVKLSVAHIFRQPTLRHLAHLNILNGKKQLGNDDDCDYDHSPLVEPTTRACLLQKIDSLGIDIRSDAVANILPVTQFQEEKVVRGINDSRQFCNYFYLDLGLGLDISDFKRNCSFTLERFPVLTAYFLPLLGKFWQVIPRQLGLPFQVYDVDQDLDQAFLDFCLKDKEEVSPIQPPIAFVLLRHKDLGVRFVLRLSHAQYDGISLPTIIHSLLGHYNDEAICRPPDFSKLVTYAHRRRFKSIAYWKRLLRGSSITRTPSKLAPKIIPDSSPTAIDINAEISLPHLPGNITSASLLSSAWAVLLSCVTGQNDVVYGRLVAGRNSALEGIEHIVGPCVNIVPVRVKMSSLQTPADLLLSVQEQFIALGEADSLGLRDILEHCTDWPTGSKFDSTIQHQNINEHPEFQVAGATSSIQGFRNPHNMPQSLYMMSYPRGDQLRIELSANTHIMTIETAHVLLDGLCRIVEKLSNRLDAPLRSCLDELDMTCRLSGDCIARAWSG